MGLLIYEWKKLCKRKIICVFMVVLLIINAGMFLQEFFAMRFKNSDLYHIRAYYMEQFSGPVSEETQEEIGRLRIRLESGEVSASPYGSAEGDSSILREMSEEISYLLSYQEEIGKYADLYRKNADVLKAEGKKEEAWKIEKLFHAYDGRELREYQETTGWVHLFSYQKSTVFILLLLFLTIAPIWVSEKEDDMLIILCTTRNGRNRIWRAKLLCAVSAAIVFTMLFIGEEILLEYCTFGLKNPMLPAYSLPEWKMMIPRLTMIGFWLLLSAGRLVSTLFAAILILGLSSLASNIALSMFISGVGIGFFLGFGEIGAKSWNPFSLLYLNETIISQQVESILGNAWYIWQVHFLAAGLAIILGCMLCLWKRRRV